jgi:membrane associated rhomboid family serine protease
MRYSTRPSLTFGSGGLVPKGVKWLLLTNIALFVLYFFAARSEFAALFQPFKLLPRAVVELFAVWQLFTYMFLHDPNGLTHILFNMLTLYMFGVDLERTWGTKRFLQYYFVCGTGAGVCVVIANYLFGNPDIPTIGASGAIYGLLLAFGVLFPDTTVLFSFLFPIKAKYFVMIMGGIAFLLTFGATGSGVSHVAHLGGMIFGYGYIKSGVRLFRVDLFGPVRRGYQQWKLQRAKKKFQVYLRKQQSGRDRWVH